LLVGSLSVSQRPGIQASLITRSAESLSVTTVGTPWMTAER
jgi:hypothetical protein